MAKVIFFDWYETLCFSRLWGKLEKENPSLFKQIQYHVFEENPQLSLDWMRGQIDFLSIVYRLMDCGLSRETIQAEFACDLSNHKLVLPELPSLLHQLKDKGYKIAVATDHFDIFGMYLYPYLGLDSIFNGYICSAEEKALKKDIDSKGEYPFFKNWLTKNNLSFKDCILIDNSKETTDIYKKLGMQTFHVPNTDTLLKVINQLLNNKK